MVQLVHEGSVELVNELKSKNYWVRNRRPKVDFYHDTPFAIDRQLEDQRLLMERNRNPQLNAFTKVDKLRSDKIAASGVPRAVAMKANVVNKVVREATGDHTYTIVPPPRSITNPDGKSKKEQLQPETNPKVRAYAKESKSKPVLVSFGHRPKSASRTFHPSTMKFRLKPGEILSSSSSQKAQIGLPVAVLAKVLHAPPIIKLDEVMSKPGTAENSEDGNPFHTNRPYDQQSSSVGSDEFGVNLEESTDSNHPMRSFDYEGLFFTKDQQAQLLYNIKRHESVYAGSFLNTNKKKKKHTAKLPPLSSSPSNPSKALQAELQESSWITSSSNPNLKISKSTLTMIPPLNHDDRPPWDEGFHRKVLPANHKFKLRESGIITKQDKPLSELLHRFSSLTVAENQLHPFCQEKQQLDIQQRSGVLSDVPKAVPMKGQSLYYDPWDMNMKVVKDLFSQKEKEKQAQLEAKRYQEALASIPDVNYYPTTRLKELQLSKQLALIEQQLQQMDREGGTEEGENYESERLMSSQTLPPYSETISPSKLKGLDYSEEFDPVRHPTATSTAMTAEEEQEEEERAAAIAAEETEGEEGKELSIDEELRRYTSSTHRSQEEGSHSGRKRPAQQSTSSAVSSSSHPLHSRSLLSQSSRQSLSLNEGGSQYLEEIQAQYPNWENTELEFRQSLHRAKQGDVKILYQQIIGQYLEQYQVPNQLYQSSASLPLLPSMESPHNSRLNSPKSSLSLLTRPLSGQLLFPSQEEDKEEEEEMFGYATTDHYLEQQQEQEEEEEMEEREERERQEGEETTDAIDEIEE